MSQNSPGVSGSAETGDQFGAAVHITLVHGPGGFRLKLLVGTPSENVGSTIDAGMVQVLNTSFATEHTLTQASSGFAGVPERGDHFGASVLSVGTGPLLLVGAPDDDYPRGVVHGPDWSRLTGGSGSSYTLTPGSSGRRFGASLTST